MVNIPVYVDWENHEIHTEDEKTKFIEERVSELASNEDVMKKYLSTYSTFSQNAAIALLEWEEGFVEDYIEKFREHFVDFCRDIAKEEAKNEFANWEKLDKTKHIKVLKGTEGYNLTGEEYYNNYCDSMIRDTAGLPDDAKEVADNLNSAVERYRDSLRSIYAIKNDCLHSVYTEKEKKNDCK